MKIRKVKWAREMAQKVAVFTAKPDDLSSAPGTQCGRRREEAPENCPLVPHAHRGSLNVTGPIIPREWHG